MKRIKMSMLLMLILSTATLSANNNHNHTNSKTATQNDSLRLAELDRFWDEVSRTVHNGDFEGYAATYHEDAVVVFTTGENKTSVAIAKALANWKQGFKDTKEERTQPSVEFRFSQRVGDENTAHETGIFSFQSNDGSDTLNPNRFIHFEALLVKRNSVWVMVMEYQKSKATQEEWDLLQ